MARSLLIEMALFLTPFLIYAALLIATKGSAIPANWSPRALGIAATAAVGLVVLGLFLFEHDRVAPPGAHYVPAQTRDGVFVPGHFE